MSENNIRRENLKDGIYLIACENIYFEVSNGDSKIISAPFEKEKNSYDIKVKLEYKNEWVDQLVVHSLIFGKYPVIIPIGHLIPINGSDSDVLRVCFTELYHKEDIIKKITKIILNDDNFLVIKK